MLQQRYEHNIEEKWQKFWLEKNIYRFDEKDQKREIYSIDTPPPFTSGDLHMGHVLSYSYIDFVARYKRMRGFNVYYPQGWDTQGFPTEVKVEKKYGRLKPTEFRAKCIEWTLEMIQRMKDQMNSMGFSPDWKYEYRTMNEDYHKKVQLSLIKMYSSKLIYRGEYPVYWCSRCGSAVAKAELDDEEKDGILNFIKFSGPDKEDLIIATTRPELMPACVALLFNPEDERYKNLSGKTAKTALGKEIPIIADKDVDKEFGSGLLMVCTFGDKMDVVWMNRHKLPLVRVIDQYGKMINSGEFDGLKIEEARKKILEKISDKIVKKQQTKQTVKVHDRCKQSIELLPSFQWFADIRNTAKEIKKMANSIRWVPDFGISYLIDWVEGAEWDWVISRQRVFGTPLPFFYCECGKTESASESDLPYYSEKASPKACSCGKLMKPETSTADCWIDSSISPLVIAGWPDESMMKKFYPISLRPQGVEIVRTWAFYTIYRSGVGLTKKSPFKEILLNGNVLAPDGKKMSKSLGNIISPADVMKDYPVDAIRQWAALSGAMAKDRPFSFEDMKHAKSFLSKIWNAARFIESLPKAVNQPKELPLIDKWIIGRLNKLIKNATEHMERFEFHYAMSAIQTFFWHDLCDNYLEYIKHRVYGEEDKEAALWTLREVLYKSILLMAPFLPHITDEINSEIFGSSESVHKSKWPNSGKEYENEAEKMDLFNKIIAEVRQYKSKNRLAQNAELTLVRISSPQPLDLELIEQLAKVSKIKRIETLGGEFSVNFF